MPQAAQATPAQSKKDQILSLFESGIHDIEDLTLLTDAKPSYVASVLKQAGHLQGYHDLYTSTGNAMNVYSKFFAGRLRFKDRAAARRSVALIDRMHRQFARTGDRAGQHHALMMAMTMYNRARWTGKSAEAAVFGEWLRGQLAPAERVGEG